MLFAELSTARSQSVLPGEGLEEISNVAIKVAAAIDSPRAMTTQCKHFLDSYHQFHWLWCEGL